MSDTPPRRLDTYRLLGRSGLRVSPLALGTMTFGLDWGWGSDREQSQRVFDLYAERGGNFLDTANLYTEGTSERFLADFLAADRDHFVLGTKYSLALHRGDPNAAGNQRISLVRSVEGSLDRMRTERIDLLWVHAWDGLTPLEETMRALDDLVRSGKVLYIGISDAPAWKVAQANTLAELRGWTSFVGLQIAYSLTRRDAERDLVPMARELGLGVTPWSPLDGGVLTGKYGRDELERQEREGLGPRTGSDRRAVGLTERKLQVVDALREVARDAACTAPQAALAWLLGSPGVTSPIVGARSVEQLAENLDALEVHLSPVQRWRLDDASAIEHGFPHDFLASDNVRNLLTGGCRIETDRP